ncbi:putative membrane protein [Natronoarchaeum philippinense]|uniref:Putative membrane protein n=1 Tax=Natronoarchaeum philippinense TaxID=558529 RepID=A0A285NSI9_NATPI|nr:SHOCT domain-containing protein [Natronoarchaeum philippinense]SNZ12425.1 putative membrane protein [Natronoarchaeum philippinense]
MPENTDDTRLVTILLVIIGAVVVFPMVFTGFGTMGSGPMMGGMWDSGMWGHGTMPGWMFVVGIVMQFLFLAALVGGGYLLYKAVTSRERDSDSALEELRLAYARGELTDDEYEQRREALERDTESR